MGLIKVFPGVNRKKGIYINCHMHPSFRNVKMYSQNQRSLRTIATMYRRCYVPVTKFSI